MTPQVIGQDGRGRIAIVGASRLTLLDEVRESRRHPGKESPRSSGSHIAGRRNGREVQADIDRPDFGQTYNALGRQVRGVFEIIWSGNKK